MAEQPNQQIVKGRCPDDDLKDFQAEIKFQGVSFVADGPVIAGINAVMSAITTLGALMNQGVVIDYEERVALGVLSKILSGEDKHVLCPVHAVLTQVALVMTGQAGVVQNQETGVYKILLRHLVEGVPWKAEVKPPTQPENDGGGLFGEIPT